MYTNVRVRVRNNKPIGCDGRRATIRGYRIADHLGYLEHRYGDGRFEFCPGPQTRSRGVLNGRHFRADDGRVSPFYASAGIRACVASVYRDTRLVIVRV